MDLSNADLQLIKKYMFGQLSSSEQQQISARLATDADFRAELDFHKKLFATLHDREGERLKKILGDVESEHFPKPSGQGNFWWLWLLAVLLLGGLIFYFREKPQPPAQPEAVFAQYFQPFENTEFVSTRSPQSPVEEAWQAYDRDEFERAATLFEKFSAAEKTAETEFFQAVALLACGKTAEALPIFENLEAAEPPAKFSEQARWYLVLAKIRLSESAAAQVFLKKMMAQPTHFKHSKSVELHRQLFEK